jgi:hypothetical protein
MYRVHGNAVPWCRKIKVITIETDEPAGALIIYDLTYNLLPILLKIQYLVLSYTAASLEYKNHKFNIFL